VEPFCNYILPSREKKPVIHVRVTFDLEKRLELSNSISHDFLQRWQYLISDYDD
jgi:hypothetical protein